MFDYQADNQEVRTFSLTHHSYRYTIHVFFHLSIAHLQGLKQPALLMARLAQGRPSPWWALETDLTQDYTCSQLSTFANYFLNTLNSLCLFPSMKFTVVNFTIYSTTESLFIAEKMLSRRLTSLDFRKSMLLMSTKLWLSLDLAFSLEHQELLGLMLTHRDLMLFFSFNWKQEAIWGHMERWVS